MADTAFELLDSIGVQPPDTLPPSPSNLLPLVGRDGFESGDLSGAEGLLTWGGPNRTHVRTADSLGIPAREGDYVLAFRYPAAADDSFAEQRFALGGEYSELVVSYDLWVPANYAHQNSPDADNNKLLRLHDGAVRGDVRFHLTLEAERNGAGYSKFKRFLSRSRGLFPPPTSIALDRQDYWPDPTYDSQEINHEPDDFISPTSPWVTTGEWHSVRLHFRSATCFDCFDGYAAFYVDGRVAKELTWNFWGQTDDGLSRPAIVSAGYLMGWANAGYPAETWFAIDDVEIRGSPP